MEKNIEQNGLSSILHKGFMEKRHFNEQTTEGNSSSNTDYGSEI
ncbi:hypothetical protein [Caldanaerobius polysaccharolyticus]|nr:hypothetical protein [Caldanaerobius polysaccharolyticus]